jgi:hypothetical protein
VSLNASSVECAKANFVETAVGVDDICGKEINEMEREMQTAGPIQDKKDAISGCPPFSRFNKFTCKINTLTPPSSPLISLKRNKKGFSINSNPTIFFFLPFFF